MTSVKSRPFGILLIVSLWIDENDAFCLTSMRGDSPVTWTVSATPPTPSVSARLMVWPRVSDAWDFAVLKPWRVADTSYTPGGSAGKRKFPCSSVTAVVTPTVEELRASTVTPGSTPPWASLTTPTIEPLCSWA